MRRFAFAALVCIGLAWSGALARADQAPPPSPTPASVDPGIDGIKLGDDAAAVLARLGLHPPGWARQPGAATEGRSFTTDGKKATIVIVFDKTIEEIAARTIIAGTQVSDAYGVKLGGSLTDLIAARGAPIAIKDGTVYVFGDPNAIRWEYEVKDNKVVSISVADCRISGVCEPLRNV